MLARIAENLNPRVFQVSRLAQGALSDFGIRRSYRRRDGGLPHRLATVATMRDGTCRMRSLCEQDDRGRLLLGTLAIGAVALAGLEPR